MQFSFIGMILEKSYLLLKTSSPKLFFHSLSVLESNLQFFLENCDFLLKFKKIHEFPFKFRNFLNFQNFIPNFGPAQAAVMIWTANRSYENTQGGHFSFSRWEEFLMRALSRFSKNFQKCSFPLTAQKLPKLYCVMSWTSTYWVGWKLLISCFNFSTLSASYLMIIK